MTDLAPLPPTMTGTELIMYVNGLIERMNAAGAVDMPLIPLPSPWEDVRPAIDAIEDRLARWEALGPEMADVLYAYQDGQDATDLAVAALVNGPTDTRTAVAAAVASQVATAGTQTRAAVEAVAEGVVTAFGTVKPAAAEKTVFVTSRGSDANDGRTLAGAKATVKAAVDQLGGAGIVQLGLGTISAGGDLDPASGTVIRGASRGLSTIAYTGRGAAVRPTKTPGVRTYQGALVDLLITGPGKATDTVGVDLDSVSEFTMTNVIVAGFGKGIYIHSAINGGATYTRLTNVKAQGNGIGFAIHGSGSNGTVAVACRANGNDIGIDVYDSNNTYFVGAQIEVNTLGIRVGAPGPGLADMNVFSECRFENNTKAWETTANARYTVISGPRPFGTYTFTDAGTATAHTGIMGPWTNYVSSAHQSPQGAFRWTRTANGGSSTPAVVFCDSNTAAGTPVTVQVETERATGSFIRGMRGGVMQYEVTAAGHFYLRNRGIVPTAPPSGGLIFVDAGALKYIGSSGTVTTLAPA